MSSIKTLCKTTVLCLFFWFPSISLADRLIFVVNTTEQDNRGAVTAPYLDEDRWRREWQAFVNSFGPENKTDKIRFVTIRAHTNQEITRGLELWLKTNLPPESAHKIIGLAIYSHGGQMSLYNESREVRIELPADLKTVLAPVVGRFAPGARIFFSGCNLLWGQSAMTAEASLKSIAEALQMSDGLIYANYSKGFDPYTLAVSPFNSDVKINKRIASLTTYLIWPISAPALPIISKFIFNQGFALAVKSNQTELLKVQQSHIFKP